MTRQRENFSYRMAAGLLRPPLMALTRREWSGAENLPDGGVVVCGNHLSELDPITLAHFLHDHGRPPRFLAKASLFDLPVAGRVLKGAKQIPVERQSVAAGQAFDAAVAAVRAGECVVIYPEATLTRDPQLWPMTGKTGAARVALETGCPVVPVAQWGVQEILGPYARAPRLLPRKRVRVRAGAPVDLSAWEGRAGESAALREATAAILDAVTAELAVLRGERPPAQRWDPRRGRPDGPDAATTPAP